MTYPVLETIKTPYDLKSLPLDRLPELAHDIRHAICDQVAQSGGHLAPNLGVVELSIALHYVFDFSYDRLLFDVGHQCYPHKLLTGRLDMLSKLRTREGMAGFPEPRESGYDLFSVGHAGTGVSTAVGLARGDQMMGAEDRKAVTIVGDSSIVNGVSMEGLNNAGTLKRQFLCILNDNGMSIGEPQGAIANYFDKVRLSRSYQDFKNRAHRTLEGLPGGHALEEIYHRLGEMAKAALHHEHIFEHMGLICVGPVDGHDLDGLIEILNEVKDIDRPVLLHVKTVKGKGFDFSTGDPTTFHSPKPFRIEGCRVEVQSGGRAFTTAYADKLTQLMDEDKKIVAVTAGMPDGTGLAEVVKKHPDRILDVGIAESHAVDMGAGMAKAGMKPFITIYSTFMQRAFDQMFQEVSLQNLPVRFCMDRAGMVGGDGAVHHGFTDIAFTRVLPNFVLTAAIDEPSLEANLRFMKDYNEGPSATRYPRDNVPAPVNEVAPAFELGKALKLKEGEDLHILAYGTTAYTAIAAREELESQGYSISVYDARFAKPLDIELLKELVATGKPIITIEDHAVNSGFGSCVIDALNELGLPTAQVHRLGHQDVYTYQGSRGQQLEEAGIDQKSLTRKIRQLLDPSVEAVEADAKPAEVEASL